MRYVRVEPLLNQYGYHLDPDPYLDVLQDMSSGLPAGAMAFVADPEHYNFHSPRCVKDLTLSKAALDDEEGKVSLEMDLAPNEWKHASGLRIKYSHVQSFRVDAAEADGMLPRLGSVQLDEALPHSPGVAHEIAFTCGSITVIAVDLLAMWG